MAHLFGTDGVRGTSNEPPMTADIALRIAAAAGRHFRRDKSDAHRVVIGKDTRLSGYMIENALTAGLTSTGMNVLLLGPVPTPAVGFLTRSMRADLGIMVSASHNPYADNGIKFFGPDGFKLSDEDEAEIEAIYGGDIRPCAPAHIGHVRRIDDAAGRYIEFLKTTLPRNRSLLGLKVVVDCAHGAAWRVAPELLWELGAEVVSMGVSPDGTNINRDCGSTHPGACAAHVRQVGADLGIALDGDADRLILIDERGKVADGDQILALFARRWAEENRLRQRTLVATVMSNHGLEQYLRGMDLRLVRTPVGDRHVVARMRAGGWNLGGEQSGHIVMTDHSTTGDGLLAALQFMAAMLDSGKPASQLAHSFDPVPQRLENIRFPAGGDLLAAANVRAAIADAERRLSGTGRVLVRKSGTEPVLRVMAEGADEGMLAEVLEGIKAAVKAAAASPRPQPARMD